MSEIGAFGGVTVSDWTRVTVSDLGFNIIPKSVWLLY